LVDFFSHALWAFALFHREPSAVAYILFSLVPDMLFAAPAILLFLGSGFSLKKLSRFRKLPHESASKLPFFSLVRTVYRMSHSWLVMAAIAVLVGIVYRPLVFPFVGGVLLHLSLDLFTHKRSMADHAGQMPLYPLSEWKVEGIIHWSDRRFLAVNYGLLCLAYILIWAGVF